jgi:hypothetical protein
MGFEMREAHLNALSFVSRSGKRLCLHLPSCDIAGVVVEGRTGSCATSVSHNGTAAAVSVTPIEAFRPVEKAQSSATRTSSMRHA